MQRKDAIMEIDETGRMVNDLSGEDLGQGPSFDPWIGEGVGLAIKTGRGTAVIEPGMYDEDDEDDVEDDEFGDDEELAGDDDAAEDDESFLEDDEDDQFDEEVDGDDESDDDDDEDDDF